MINAFVQASTVEAESLLALKPFICQTAFDGQYILTDKGRLAKELQKTVGDALMKRNGEMYSVEIKAERENKYGNFFLETWSNRKWFTPGWMLTLNADILFYHFLEQDQLYIMNFQRLKEWAWHQGGIYRFPEREQSKYDQRNDTWGRCVPIKVIGAEVGFSVWTPSSVSKAA